MKEVVFDQPVVKPVAVRSGYAIVEGMFVIQFLMKDGTKVSYALTPEATQGLADQIEDLRKRYEWPSK